MSSDKSVAIVGHSLVPQAIERVSGANIHIYRSPGAKVADFDTNRALSRVIGVNYDLIILFLGGNDIHDNCTPSIITSDLIKVVEQLHSSCGSHIALVLIEHRNPPPHNRFNVTAENYNRIASNINNRLKRKLKSKPYVQFLSIGAKPFQRGVTDGVHLNYESKKHLKRKFQNTIKRFVDNDLINNQ